MPKRLGVLRCSVYVPERPANVKKNNLSGYTSAIGRSSLAAKAAAGGRLSSRAASVILGAKIRKGAHDMTTTFRLAAAMLALGALAGCDKAGDSGAGGPKSMEQAKQEAAKLERPKPGLYKQTMTITKFEIPGAPPAAAAQMQAAMSKAQEHEFCMTAEMANQGFRDMFDKVGKNGACKYDRFEVSGGRIDALLHCQNAAEGKGTITMAGTVGEDGSDVTVAVDQQGGRTPMANAKIAMHMVSQRVGECTGGGQAPGK